MLERTGNFGLRIPEDSSAASPAVLWIFDSDNLSVLLASETRRRCFFSGELISANCRTEIKTGEAISIAPILYETAIFAGVAESLRAQPIGTANRLYLWQRSGDSAHWLKVGEIPLFKNSQAEFALFDLARYLRAAAFGSRGAIAVSLRQPLADGDKLTIWGSWRETFAIAPSPAALASQQKSVAVSDSSTTVLAADLARSKVILLNSGTADIYLSYTPTAAIGSHAELVPPDYRLELTEAKFQMSAICASGEASTLQITEVWG